MTLLEDVKTLLAALSDAEAERERERAAHRESLRLAAERNGWTRDERDAARADAERLAERLSSTGEAYHAQHHDSRPMDECVTSEGCRLNCRALALHRERRPAEEGWVMEPRTEAGQRLLRLPERGAGWRDASLPDILAIEAEAREQGAREVLALAKWVPMLDEEGANAGEFLVLDPKALDLVDG